MRWPISFLAIQNEFDDKINKPLYLTILWSNKERHDTLNNGEEIHLGSQYSHTLHNESCQEVEVDSTYPSKYAWKVQPCRSLKVRRRNLWKNENERRQSRSWDIFPQSAGLILIRIKSGFTANSNTTDAQHSSTCKHWNLHLELVGNWVFWSFLSSSFFFFFCSAVNRLNVPLLPQQEHLYRIRR